MTLIHFTIMIQQKHKAIVSLFVFEVFSQYQTHQYYSVPVSAGRASPGRNWEPRSPSLKTMWWVVGGGWWVVGGWVVGGGSWVVGGGWWVAQNSCSPSKLILNPQMTNIFLKILNLRNFAKFNICVNNTFF